MIRLSAVSFGALELSQLHSVWTPDWPRHDTPYRVGGRRESPSPSPDGAAQLGSSSLPAFEPIVVTPAAAARAKRGARRQWPGTRPARVPTGDRRPACAARAPDARARRRTRSAASRRTSRADPVGTTGRPTRIARDWVVGRPRRCRFRQWRLVGIGRWTISGMRSIFVYVHPSELQTSSISRRAAVIPDFAFDSEPRRSKESRDSPRFFRLWPAAMLSTLWAAPTGAITAIAFDSRCLRPVFLLAMRSSLARARPRLNENGCASCRARRGPDGGW